MPNPGLGAPPDQVSGNIWNHQEAKVTGSLDMVDLPPVRLAARLAELASALKRRFPSHRVEVGDQATEMFPSCSSIGLCTPGENGDELVVLTVEVWTDGERAEYRCELSRGDGELLAEIPPLHHPVGVTVGRAAVWWDSVLDFVDQCEALFAEALSDSEGSSDGLR